MILSNLFTSSYSNPTNSSNAGNTPSADVMAKVSKIMQAQTTDAPKLNAALASDNTTLSGLGKMLNALTSFQSVAKSLSGSGATALPSSQLLNNVTDLVSTYNSLNASLKGLQQGDLKANGSAARIQAQLARAFSSLSNGTAGSASLTLASIGITTQKNGDLAIDTTKLQAAINANPGNVSKLFSSSGKGIADNLVSLLQGMVGSSGSIQKDTAAITKDISTINTKKSNLAKALTNQANALVKAYSSQQSSTTGTNGSLSLFSLLDQ